MDLAFTAGIVDELLRGFGTTLTVLAGALVGGNLLALPIALARLSRHALLWLPAYLFILFIRGTPLIVQLFMIYYGLAQFRDVRSSIFWPILKDPVYCALIALSLSTAAYSAEVLRGAIRAVPRGPVEAARALGLPRRQILRLVTLPLALRICLPALCNETVLLMKASAIVFTITVRDLMGEANIIRAQTFRTYEPLLSAALLYILLTFAIVQVFGWGEARLARERRALRTGDRAA